MEPPHDLPDPDAADRRLGPDSEPAPAPAPPAGGSPKLIPEWKLGGDDQIVVVGVVVLALLLVVGGWLVLRDGDGGGPEEIAVEVDGDGGGDDTTVDRDDRDPDDADVDGADGAVDPAAGDAGPDDGADAGSSEDPTPALRATLARYRGVSARAVDGVAVLEGHVGTEGDAIDAVALARDVPGIDSVDDRLGILAPEVEAALVAFGVVEPGVEMDDTAARVTGTVGDADHRRRALDAAAAVPGVSGVVDGLTLAETEDEDDGSSPATTAPGDDGGLRSDVETAVAGIGEITVTVDGDTAVLEGVVGTAEESAEAGAAALAVDGVGSVDNRLTVLAPDAAAALASVGDGAADATVSMEGTVATLSGTVPTEDDRAAAIRAVAAVPGISVVVDQLDVAPPVADRVERINAVLEINPIQFASNQATILEESFDTLDEVVAVLEGPPVSVEIQGYTDVRGEERANLDLSQARADAVLEYLRENGVDTSRMRAVGYGETEEFGEGDSAEALAANRRVRFELLG